MPRLYPCIAFSLLVLLGSIAWSEDYQSLKGTEPLTWEGDLASQMVDGIDKFLLNEIEQTAERRAERWKLEDKTEAGWEKFVAEKRKRLSHILGLRDKRVPFEDFEMVGSLTNPALVAETERVKIYRVRWPVLDGIYGEGLLLQPMTDAPIADVVAIGHAQWQPEWMAGIQPKEHKAGDHFGNFALYLAEHGCRVVIPTLISRDLVQRGPPEQPTRARLTNREYLYRPSFELGRHMIGYEVQKVLAAIDCFAKQAVKQERETSIAIVGYGDGGMLTLLAGALDPRVDITSVGGYFGNRKRIWKEPIDRNLFGVLTDFADAELATLHQRLLVDDCGLPVEAFASQEGGAPGELLQPTDVKAEVERANGLLEQLGQTSRKVEYCGGDSDPFDGMLPRFSVLLLTELLGAKKRLEKPCRTLDVEFNADAAAARQARQIAEIEKFNQRLLTESPYARAEFMKGLDFSSLDAYQKSVEPYRKKFREEIIGQFDQELLPPQPRSRQAYETEKYIGYEVVLDVFPDVFAYGILLVPKGIKAGERRPVVVCQHGLEGRPQDVVAGDHYAYHDYAAKLAERGFVTFAPQNPYIFKDRFRSLQRKANPLGKTLFSVIVPQHEQIVRWLGSLEFVDKDRIGFYGLSYGGKTAMRVPALVDGYCLSICSADFNDWVWKNASTRSKYSYVWTGEYEIFEFDLGSTFNYSEMAALIAPRPFMVERGHFDGVAPDERVALEFAKVRHLYAAKLGIGDRTEIEWFVGPHTIHGKGTFDFLHKHLNWPQP